VNRHLHPVRPPPEARTADASKRGAGPLQTSANNIDFVQVTPVILRLLLQAPVSRVRISFAIRWRLHGIEAASMGVDSD
jgi:hypothetical protein